MRHAYATLALGRGIHPKVVSDALGHADAGLTLNTYSHAAAGMHQAAASAVDAVLRGA